MKLRRWQALLMVAFSLPAFAHAQETPAGVARDVTDGGTRQTSDDRVPKTKKKKKAPKHPTIAIGHAVTLDVTARIEGDIRGATPEMGLDDPEATWQDRRLGIQGSAFKR